MKLITHNMLQCNIKGVKQGYPFRLEATEHEEVDADFDPQFLRRLFTRVDYQALRQAAEALNFRELPVEASEASLEDADFVQAYHHALLELRVTEGALICPETGRRFVIHKGIPNLLLREDECEPQDSGPSFITAQ